VRKTQKKEKTAHPTDVRTLATWVRSPRRRARPYLASVRALRAQACAPLTRVRAPLNVCAPHLAGVHAPRVQACAPLAAVRAPHLEGVRVLRAQECAPLAGVRALPRRRVRPPSAVRAPLLVGVRAPPHRRRARPNPQTCGPPSSLACAPYPASVCAPLQTCAPCPQLCAPCPPNARALIAGGRRRYIRRGPLHPHFTTLGFVSWDSFVGSLHEVVGMVQHFRFLPF
jgi:hypothetical protein